MNQYISPEQSINGAVALKTEPDKSVDNIGLDVFSANDFANEELPKRKFHDQDGLIPCEGVTLLFGDGGTGKSLLALQLCAATALGEPWLGLNVRKGPVFYYSAEDGKDEAHIRLDSIAKSVGASLDKMSDINIAFMAGKECVLAANDGKGIIKKTTLFADFESAITRIKPRLIIVDNLIDVFAGNMIDPPQAKQFMHLLTGISINHGCPILMLAHPSVSGMNNGAGDGGTKAWSNSARSRLYLSRVVTKDNDNTSTEDDPNARVLTTMKANYGPTGGEIKMRWEEGVFIHDAAIRSELLEGLGAEGKAERVFLHLLWWHEKHKLNVSPNKSVTYAPSVFGRHPQSEGVSNKRFERAMFSLLDDKKIEVVEHGSPSKRTSKLVIIKDDE